MWSTEGELLGVIWADDPADRLLPSRPLLQALRVFANQATAALTSARHFEEMRYLAEHDPLTRLPNRLAFSQRLGTETARSGRYHRPFALVLCDLDGFKGLNDRNGHHAGDEALVRLGDLLHAQLRQPDMPFRIGGDEFAMILPETDEAEVRAVVDRIAADLRGEADSDDQLGASFGVAVFPVTAATPTRSSAPPTTPCTRPSGRAPGCISRPEIRPTTRRAAGNGRQSVPAWEDAGQPPPASSHLDADSLPALVRLRGLLEVTKLVRSDEDLERLLGAIARTIAESLGFGTVVVNLYRPAWDDFKVSTVHGGDAAQEALIGDTRGWDVWAPLLNQRFNRRGAYFIPHGSFDWDSFAPNAYRPAIEESSAPDAWHPEDALFVPLRHSDGHLLGVLAVDEPASGRMPTDDDLDVLVALGAHAALALQSAQEAADLARHRAQLEQLLQVSSQLTETFSIEAILQSVCDGIAAALGFQNTSIDLDDPATGGLRARASHGWELDQPSVSSVMSLAELQTMMEPRWEVEGCFLVPSAEARGRLHEEHLHYQSVMNGAGPRAWNDHWLFVPLYTRSGELTGVIWADDPGDRLLPSATTLQALRMFANQATTALDSAAQFEEMRFLADHDPLTRLFNRRAFNTRAGSRGRPLSPLRPLLRADRRRPERLQVAQRHARPPVRRRGAAGVCQRARRRPPRGRRRVPDRRRRVRAAAARGDAATRPRRSSTASSRGSPPAPTGGWKGSSPASASRSARPTAPTPPSCSRPPTRRCTSPRATPAGDR